jgi:Co/Zn/Cd efflux system component
MSARLQASALRLVLGINAAMFVIEFGAGWMAQSTGLIADSFDMLADAIVYAISLSVVFSSDAGRAKSATLSGVFQVSLGLGALFEVARRYLVGSSPEPAYMILVSLVALTANVVCLRVITKHRDDGVHMKASWIFSRNDVLANISVIVSGVLVATTAMASWDLVAGVGIGFLVLSGGYRILKAASEAKAAL